MALVYTSASGVAGDQFDHPTVNAQRAVVLQELSATGPSAQKSQIGYVPATGNVSGVLTLLAAGHAPGIYLISAVSVVRVASINGDIRSSWSFSAPSLGATSVLGTNATLIVPGVNSLNANHVVSDGVNAITLRWSAVGVISGGQPVDLYGSALLVAQ